MIFFLFFICVISGLEGQDTFYFKTQPSNAVVISGKPVTFECEVSHNGSIIYYWSFNDSRLTNTGRKYQIGSNLHISRVDRLKDAGEYMCIAENSTTGFSVASNAARLDISWIGEASVQLHNSDDDGNIREGDDVLLRCNVEGSDEIHYQWFRNVDELNTKTDRIIPKNKKLYIKDVTSHDNGIYRCLAYNDAGSSESIVNFPLKVDSKNGPNIKILPKDVIVKKGEAAKLECMFAQANYVKWSLNHDVQLNSSRRIQYPNGTMTIPKVKNSDEGIYTCTGVRLSGSSIEVQESYSASLKISYIDDLTQDLFEPRLVDHDTMILPERKPFELTCLPPAGLPKPKIWWQLPSGMKSEGSTILFEQPNINSDTGRYVCHAENFAGLKNYTLNILVSSQPIILSHPMDITADEETTIHLQCLYKATKYPASVVKWKKDGRVVGESSTRVFTVGESGNSTLVIRQLQASDRGNYNCEVNTTGFRILHSTPAVVGVREKLKFSPRPVSKKLELGTTAKIYCKALGTPHPVIKWLKEPDRRIELPPNVQDMNGTLIFKKTSMSDKGKYTCIATSTQGTINATVDIDVIVAPRFRVLPQNPTEVTEGHSIMIHCMAEGDPHPTIKWDKDGIMNGLDQKRFHTLENGTLLVDEVYLTDNGKYGCTAGNSGGLKREEVVLIVRSLDSYQPGDMEELEEGSMMTKTVTITLSAATAYILLVIGLMLWCRYRRQKRKQAYLNANPEGILLAKAENGDAALLNGGDRQDNDTKSKMDVCNKKSDGGDTTQSHSSSQSKRSSKASYDKLAYSRSNLQNLKLLGHGTFGEVYIATAETMEHPVLVKSLQHTRDELVLVDFKREIDLFHKMSHENVVKLIGLCRDTEPHYLVLEHTDWGDLKHFLQSTKKERSKLTLRQILDIAKQISTGMEHLSNARLIHKDLATRNCIIASDLQVKISSVALTKDIHFNDYGQFRNQLLPIRWLPAEAVFEDEFSTKSDVYSFGVTCWELFNQGERPYHSIQDNIVLDRLQRRELILKPSKLSPNKLSMLITTCLSSSPNNRPTFSHIAVVIGEVLDAL